MIFYDVQVQDAGNSLGMAPNADLNLAVNRLKSLQKLYLFEQKGGENYLGWVTPFLWRKNCKRISEKYNSDWLEVTAAPATVDTARLDNLIITNWWSLFK